RTHRRAAHAGRAASRDRHQPRTPGARLAGVRVAGAHRLAARRARWPAARHARDLRPRTALGSMTEPRVATVSVDVDPVDLHLIGYGYSGLPPDPLVSRRALPRLLEIFGRCGVRATLFVVGRDAPEQRAALAAAAASGHEIASHSQ